MEVLIDQETKTRKLPLMQATFHPEEARVIAALPLSQKLPLDRLIWLGTTTGVFSVCIAYHLGMELQERERGQTSTVEKGKVVWRILWTLRVPNHVKLFLWRACNNILPTKQNLLKRRIVEEDRCPCCTIEEESTDDVLKYYPAAQDVWGAG